MSRLMAKKKIGFLRRSNSSPVVKEVNRSTVAVRPTNSSLRQRMSAERLGSISSTDSASLYSDAGSLADSNGTGNPNETLDSPSLRSITRRNSAKLNGLVKKGSQLRLKFQRSTNFRSQPPVNSVAFDLITAYLQVMDYPEQLQRKVHKKIRKHIKSSSVGIKKRFSSPSPRPKHANFEYKLPDVEVQVACELRADCHLEEKLMVTNDETKYFQDAGALEDVILDALPEKNSIDCFWHLYGDSLCRSHLFFFDQSNANGSTPLKPEPFFGGNSLCNTLSIHCALQLLRNTASSFRRQHVMPGKYLAILPVGALYVVRRGAARIMVKGKCAAELPAGSMIESDVLYPGYISVSFPRVENALNKAGGSVNTEHNEKRIYLRAHVSICANIPMPTSSYAYGCEFGVLTRDDFEALIESNRTCSPAGMVAVRRNLQIFKNFVRLRVKAQIEEDRRRADLMREKVELESRRSANKQLAVACMEGCLLRVMESLTAGASLEHCIDAASGRKAVHVATDLQHVDILTFLVEKNEALVHSRDDYGQTCLHICCAKNDSPNVELMIRVLTSKGASMTCQDVYGNTPLHLLAAKGDLKLLTFAENMSVFKLDETDRLSPLEITNKAGQTPLDVCRTQQARRILKPKTNLSGYNR